MVLVATQVKRRRGTTAENDAFTGAEGEITVDTEKHELRVHDGVTQGGFKIGGGSGSGRNTGDIFLTKRTDTSLAGAVECDGATYNTTDFTGGGSIGELLEAGKLDYISLSAYSTAISTKGWCDKIGWDGAGTTAFRVPTLNAHIVQTNNIPVVGNGMTLGLTDGTHNGGMISSPAFGSGGIGVRDGCYGTQAGSSNYGSYSFGDTTTGLTTDGTKSGIIADTSDTAQLRVMIQIANGATDEALETCTGVLADVAALKYDYVVEFQAPTAENNYTWFRKYKSGWVEQGGVCTGSASGGVDVSLPITMANINYTVFATCCFSSNTANPQSSYTVRIQKNNSTVSKVNFIATWCSSSQIGYSDREFCWNVQGFAA